MARHVPKHPCRDCGKWLAPRPGGRCHRCTVACKGKCPSPKLRTHYVLPAVRTPAEAAEVERRVKLYAEMDADCGISYDDPRLWGG